MRNFILSLLLFVASGLKAQIVLTAPSQEEINSSSSNTAALLIDTTIDVLNQLDSRGRLILEVPSSEALNLYFSDFHLSRGSVLRIRNSIGRIIYSFNYSDNPHSRFFAIPPVEGHQIELEVEGDVKDSKMMISEVGYFFKSEEDIKTSGFCEVDVNCSEGDEWQDQKKGVVRLLLKTNASSVYCSGTLLNNTARNCRPFIYSADHCLDGVSANNLNQSFAYFNYENSTCGSDDGASSEFVLGMKLRASQTFDDGADFILLELNSDVPLEYSPYFNGWNRTDGNFSNGVSIHHPNGDVKKISTYNSFLSTSNSSQLTTNAFWQVNWVETNNGHGVTEAGSSGSPLFNQEKLVVGALSVGSSFCSKPNDPDFYGKVHYGWDQGIDSTQRLDYWLDPIQSGEEKIPGSYFPCNDTAIQYLPIDSIVILGNLVQDALTLYIEQKESSKVDIEIYSTSGQLVFIREFDASNIINETMNVGTLRDGAYFVKVVTGAETKILRFIVVN